MRAALVAAAAADGVARAPAHAEQKPDAVEDVVGGDGEVERRQSVRP